MKSPLFTRMKTTISILALLGTALPLLAIQDSNSNNLSDVWEKHYNSGVLFPSTNSPYGENDDPDADGQTNAAEAVSGTDPFSSAMPDGVVRCTIVNHPASPSMFTLSWPSVSGKVYKLSTSTDLLNWADSPELIAGDDSTIELGVDAMYQDGTIPEKTFWRVVIEDEDPDGDTLTTWEELQLGYNPYYFDTDGDGVADNLDQYPLQNAIELDPDGLGLVSSLENGVIGRWDFETIGVNGGLESTPTSFGECDIANTNADWDGAATWAGLYQGFPRASLHLKATSQFVEPHVKLPGGNFWLTTQTMCMWIKFDQGTLDTNPANRPLASWIQNYYASDVTSLPAFSVLLAGDQIKFVSGRVQTGPVPEITSLATLTIPQSIDFDDGEWHSLIVNFFDNGSGINYSAWIDTVSLGTQGGSKPLFNMSHTNSKVLIGKFEKDYQFGYSGPLQATIDRLRFYNRNLTTTERSSLFDQDADGDGLYDRTESKNRFWVDENSDGFKSNEETDYILNPFFHDLPTADHDNDGLTSLYEQDNPGPNLIKLDPANYDSDGDLLPDGWETLYAGLSPTIFNDINADTEINSSGGAGDGLTVFEEWIHGTDPTVADTDGDAEDDGPEVNAGSDPTDASDQGEAIPANQLSDVTFKIGDDSSSNSERWKMIIKGTDPEKDDRTFNFASEQFGQIDTRTFKLRHGAPYKITVEHVATNRGEEGPDYDWDAQVEGLPQSVVGVSGGDGDLFGIESNGFVWAVENTDGLLGTNAGGATDAFNLTPYYTASLVPLTPKEVWSDQITNVEANGYPDKTGLSEYPYILIGAKNDSSFDVKIETHVDYASTMKNRIWYRWGKDTSILEAGTQIYSGPGVLKLESSFVAADSAPEDRHLMVLIDKDGDGSYSQTNDDVFQLKTDHIQSGSTSKIPYKFVPITETHYDAKKAQLIAWANNSQFVFQDGARHLTAFCNGLVPQFAGSEPITIARNESGLSHPVGIDFTPISNPGASFKALISKDHILSKNLIESNAMRSWLATEFNAIRAETQAAIADARENEGFWDDVIWFSIENVDIQNKSIGFNIIDPDLLVTLGKVKLLDDVRIVFSVDITAYVEDVYIYGTAEDLYDFDYGGEEFLGMPARRAAELQSGFPTLGNGGKVFKTKIDLGGTEHTPYPNPGEIPPYWFN